MFRGPSLEMGSDGSSAAVARAPAQIIKEAARTVGVQA
jgi:hypothetical protein